jgi:anti-sigma-K factor RskA
MTDEDRLLAAELAIGLVSGEEGSRAAARASDDVSFAREVEWWQQQLAPLLETGADVPPPGHLRERIEARLGVAMRDTPAFDQSLPGRAAGGRQAARWRWIGVGGALGALAASFLAWVVVPPPPPVAPAPPVVRAPSLLVASLAPTGGDAKPVTVVIERERATVRLSGPIDVPANRVGQLWRIAPGGKPVSLGVLPAATASHLRLARATLPVAGDQVAISIEPAGGSPTGQPTGPVIAAGALAEV